jgi:hypothetical protein
MKVLRFLPALLLLTGCSVFNHRTQTFTVTTRAPEADVYINGELAGKSPVSRELKRNENIKLLVKKEGYLPEEKLILHHFSTSGRVDIISSCWLLFPALGLLSPGAWTLNETNVNVRLFQPHP